MEKCLKGAAGSLKCPLSLGIAAGVSYWLFEAALDCFLFGRKNFFNALLPTGGHELWMRSSVALLILVATVSTCAYWRRRRSRRLTFERERELHMAMVEASPAFFVAIDPEGKTLAMNKAMLYATGYTAEEAEGTDYLETFVPEKDRKAVEEVFARIIGKREPTRNENHVMTKNGRLLLVEWHGRPIFNSDGEFQYLVGFGTDITEHRKAQEKLVKSEARYRLLAENATDVIWTTDLDFNLTYISPSVKNLFGRTHPRGGVGDLRDLFTPASRQLLVGVYREILESVGKSDAEADMTRTMEVEGRHKNGRTVCAEVKVKAMRDDDGRVIGLIGVARNIEERKRFERERKMLAMAVEQAAEGILVADSERKIWYVNPAFEEITGYPADKIIGEKIEYLGTREHSEGFYRGIWRKMESGASWIGRLSGRKRDGSTYQADVTFSPVRDENGTIANYMAIIRDVTKEVALEQQLLHAQKMEAVGNLAAGIAHDFNNVLSIILGLTAILKKDAPPGSSAQDDLEQIEEAGRRAAGLTRQLLMFSRRQVGEKKPMKLNGVVGDLEKMIRRLIGENIQFETRLGARRSLVNADVMQMEQVVMNLVVNARDAMPRGGTLVVETLDAQLDEREAGEIECDEPLRPGPYVVLKVSDTGIGISPDQIPRIFEPFYTTKPREKGTGLGLATVYGIVKQHGGYLRVISAPGEGTVFEIYLPAIEAETERVVTRVETNPPAGRECVLLVEDEEAVRTVIRKMLENFGYKVMDCSNNMEAMELFRNNEDEIELLLTDVVMPGGSGVELCDTLRLYKPELKVLFVSGYPDESHTERRDSAFIEKPFRDIDLLKKVRKLLNGETA